MIKDSDDFSDTKKFFAIAKAVGYFKDGVITLPTTKMKVISKAPPPSVAQTDNLPSYLKPANNQA